ncbi:MAG: hypothetical protein RQ715_05905 [Methylococcales bacterium]|nr:hypothetical protein [Methylococcales bacterium]
METNAINSSLTTNTQLRSNPTRETGLDSDDTARATQPNPINRDAQSSNVSLSDTSLRLAANSDSNANRPVEGIRSPEQAQESVRNIQTALGSNPAQGLSAQASPQNNDFLRSLAA